MTHEQRKRIEWIEENLQGHCQAFREGNTGYGRSTSVDNLVSELREHNPERADYWQRIAVRAQREGWARGGPTL